MTSAISAITPIAAREQVFDRELCTFAICDISLSWYKYRPSLPANATFTALFFISAVIFIIQGLTTRRFLGFTIAMVLGTLGETIGYIGRILMWDNPWKQIPFMIQICCLTLAPAFLAAGIYFTLSRIVTAFGPENSRIRPRWYPRIFIPCDILALALQGAGGGIASTAGDNDRTQADLGKDIMVAGLVIQVITLTVFMGLVADFAFRTHNRIRALGNAALDPNYSHLRSSSQFKLFLLSLAGSTVCIYVRSIYRIAELSEGWDGPLLSNEGLFIGMESVFVVISVFLLNAFHPSRCFRAGFDKGQ
ncbi:RTA1 domain protein, putative [Trichophyton benhamiae CBS 112371]|uniref:RTA1 domain protein, putative n=1 Tax=Arthroderma benhamiae (strain ATCC MYA-4681 / CBS 112371) TaxID=663331 RepID=D4ATF1_ARTBC|nr:RTA1 domain protein, putative [Trichophyton benhamiae CBS 112371]EFE33570.1 RTA1 domain protein, putative [Trichophyton benhamiae CBS 112371]